MDTNPEQKATRQVLNAHVGLANIIEAENIDTLMIDTFQIIKDKLSDHCGPYGRNAIIHVPGQATEQPIFTKDGIHIVSEMEFISPLERYVKNMIAYIGGRLERAAGDGTTSSMIISVAVMQALKKHMVWLAEEKDVKLTFNQFHDIFVEFENGVEERLDKLVAKYTDEWGKTEVRNAVFCQASTSTHGNTKLAGIIADMFAMTPGRAWEHIVYRRDTHESADLFKIEETPGDYSGRARVFSNKIYNSQFGNAFSIEGAKLMVFTSDIMGQSPQLAKAEVALKNAIETGEKLVIVAPANHIDNMVQARLDTILASKADTDNIGIFMMDMRNPKVNDMTALMAVLGHVWPYDENDCIITRENVDVSWEDMILHISNVVDYGDLDYHPDADNPDSPLGQLLHVIDESVGLNDKSVATANASADQVREAKRLYCNMLIKRPKVFVIGGGAYDNAAGQDVLEDALKASRAGLRDGFALGGFNTLKEALVEYMDDLNEKDIACWTRTDHTISILVEAFLAAIEEVIDHTLKHAPKNMDVVNDLGQIDKKSHSEIHDMLEFGGKVYDVLTGHVSTLDDLTKGEKPVIVQPKSADLTLIKRFREVALKFLFTERIIIPGGVFINEDEK